MTTTTKTAPKTAELHDVRLQLPAWAISDLEQIGGVPALQRGVVRELWKRRKARRRNEDGGPTPQGGA